MAYSQNDFARMVALQVQLAQVLNRANQDRMPADLAVFALARLQRQILDAMGDQQRTMVVDQVVVPFLRREVSDDQSRVILH